MFEPSSSPLQSEDPRDWERLIESLGPASLIVAIEGRMSAELLARTSADDILQETLLHLWRDRGSIEWRGPKSFRSLVLSIASNRIRDAADVEGAQKRGGGSAPVSLDASTSGGSRPRHGGAPASSTTPSRLAIRREQVAAMQRALLELPGELRDVVRLRAFEQLPLEDIAQRLGLGVEAVRHRFRKGSAQYARRLRALDSSSQRRESATQGNAGSSP